MPVYKKINFRNAINQNNTGTNGGVMSLTEFDSMPVISVDDKVNGSTITRKIFVHPKLTGDGIELNPNFLEVYAGISYGYIESDGVYIYGYPVSETSTQADWVAPVRAYGCHRIVGDISTNTTNLTITKKQVAVPLFQVGDKVVVCKSIKTSGVWETYQSKILTISAVSGNSITLVESIGNLVNSSGAITTGVQGVNEFLTITSLYAWANVKATIDNVNVTSASGQFNSASVILNGQESVSDTYTLSFTTSTVGEIISARHGVLSAFSIAGGIAPTNPEASITTLFSIPPAAFSGTFLSGDSIVFTVHAASVAMAYQRVVEPNAATELRDKFNQLAVIAIS